MASSSFNIKKNFRLNVALRVAGLCLNIFLLVILFEASYWATLSLSSIILLLQVVALVGLMERTNKELVGFLNSIKYDDFTNTYQLSGRGGSFDDLNQSFTQVLAHFREIRAEKEAEYQYLKNIIQHIGIGILSFDKSGNVQIINTAAKRLFRVNRLRNLSKLEEFSPELIEQFRTLGIGEKALVRIRKDGEIIELAIYAAELYLKGEEFRFITIQNIHSELEEQEMQAWQNLIRVLTHEIMNSVTPVSSLAATVVEEVGYLQKQSEAISRSDLDDIQLAVQTIQRRSASLINFVNEFRSLTHTSTPNFSHVSVASLFEHVYVLMQYQCKEAGIVFTTHLKPESLSITADQGQIEQVLINIIKNSVQALESHTSAEGKQQKTIELIGEQGPDNHPLIRIKDNGPGIEKDALDRIFIPFFTTKKSGSGIGLSLSRQIMRQHKGTITASSAPNEGTEFTLKF